MRSAQRLTDTKLFWNGRSKTPASTRSLLSCITMWPRSSFFRSNRRQNQRLMRRPPLRLNNQTKSNVEFSAGKKNRQNKNRNKWRLHRPPGQERSLVKREMALAEVRRRKAAKKLFPFRQQVLRRMFTVRRHTALTRNKV